MKIINDIIQKSKSIRKELVFAVKWLQMICFQYYFGMRADELSISYSEIDKLCNNIQILPMKKQKLATMALIVIILRLWRQILTGC